MVFQPPSLDDTISKQLRDYFGFKSPAFNPHISGCNKINSEKTYADIVEAITGACYLENDLSTTEKLVFKLKIIHCSRYKNDIYFIGSYVDDYREVSGKKKGCILINFYPKYLKNPLKIIILILLDLNLMFHII